MSRYRNQIYTTVNPTVFDAPRTAIARTLGDSIPKSGLLAYLKGDTTTVGEDVVLRDSSGEDNHFTIVSGTDWSDLVISAPAGNAALIAADDGTFYDGSDDPIEISVSDLVVMVGNQFWFHEDKGLAIYDAALTGTDLSKMQRYTKLVPGRYYRGMNIYSEYQTWPGLPAADWYVDSVNGDDSNAGTSVDAPFQTIAKLLEQELTDGVTVGLAAGSSWREELKISDINSCVVFGYGAGKRPVFDCADVYDTWAAVGGTTNVYSTTVTHSSYANSYMSVWEDGARLTYVEDEATCDSTAGSFTVPYPCTSPVTVKIHPTGSGDPASNGKVYEISVREFGYIFYGSPGSTVKFIRTKRNLANDGSLKTNGYIYNCIAEDGTKHNLFIGNGTVKESAAWKFDPSARGGATMFIAYSTGNTDREVLFDTCVSSDPVPAVAAGFYAHVGTGYFKQLSAVNCSCNHGGILLSGAKEITIDTAKIVYDADDEGALSAFAAPSADDSVGRVSNVFIDIRGDATGIRPILFGYWDDLTISDLAIISDKSVSGGIVYSTGKGTIRNSVFYQEGTTSWRYVVVPRTSGTDPSEVTFEQNIVWSGTASTVGVYNTEETGTPYIGDYNVFYPGGTDIKLAGVNYTSVSAYKADRTDLDQNSITDDPLFTDAANGDFNLQVGSPAAAIGAGLTNPDVEYLEIPSDETLALW